MDSQIPVDYSTYVGREVVILRPVYEDVDHQEEYEAENNPPWNYVGNVLRIESYDRNCRSFSLVDQTGHYAEVLLEYDFENGFVDIIPDAEEIQIDVDAINMLL